MTAQQRRDMVYGRRGGGWKDTSGETVTVKNAPKCEVCGLAMLVGQKKRHALCSPLMPCCDFPQDLVQDKVEHAQMHVEALQ